MSEPLPIPKFLKVFYLMKLSQGLYLTGVGTGPLGPGFYLSQIDAEKQRTVELLSTTFDSKDRFYIFELDIPNPAYKDE